MSRTGKFRLGMLVLWLIGWVVLIAGLPFLIEIALPLASAGLAAYVDFFSISVVWTVVVVLAFVVVGDGSEFHRSYIAQHTAIWSMLAVVALVTTLTGYTAYRDVTARVAGQQSSQTLLRATGGQLRDATRATLERASTLETRLRIDESKADARVKALADLELQVSELRRHAASAHSRATSAITQIDAASDSSPALKRIDVAVHSSSARKRIDAAVDSSSAIEQIRAVLGETLASTERINSALDKIGAEVTRLQANPARPFSRLRDTVTRDLAGPAEDADMTAMIAATSLVSVNFSGLAMYIWISVFYVVLVLFPWALLLLFLFRKRQQRAARIIADLSRLDPSHQLLLRALDGRELGTRPAKLLAKLRAGKPIDEQLVVAFANQAFSNIEYLVSLLLLSVLNAVGWYYVFYPQTSLGLADLIETGAGVVQLSRYFVDNLTPLTLSFVGAYFYVVQMLVRRYLADDLYPAAFLQAALRCLLVFVLSLALSVLASEIHGGKFNEIVTLAALPILLTSFLTGVYPRAGLRLLATYGNQWSNKLFGASWFPSTLVPEPTTILTGVTVWNEGRLLEESVENIQSMATVAIEQLVVGTHFSTAQIVDWIDQAILYLHAGHDGEWFSLLRKVGIRTASDLLDATAAQPLSRGRLSQGRLKTNQQRMQLVVDAITAVQSASQPTAPAASGTASGASGTAASTPGLAAGTAKTTRSSRRDKLALDKQVPLMTPAILSVICDAIVPDPNLRYVLNYYEHDRRP